MSAVALETSRRTGSVAVRHAGRTLERVLEGSRAHASDLLPALDALLGELGLGAGRLAPLETVFVGTGPGSFTGLRVGLATALGLARGTGAALCAVPSCEALAYRELAPGEEGAVLQDARAGLCTFARYRRTEHDLLELDAPRAVAPLDLARSLQGDGVLLCDDAILGDPDLRRLLGLGPEAEPRLRAGRVPRASAVLALGALRLARDGPQRPDEIEPLYLQAFATRNQPVPGRSSERSTAGRSPAPSSGRP